MQHSAAVGISLMKLSLRFFGPRVKMRLQAVQQKCWRERHRRTWHTALHLRMLVVLNAFRER